MCRSVTEIFAIKVEVVKNCAEFLRFLPSQILWGGAPLVKLVVSVAQLVARRTHDRKVVGSIPTNAVCFTVVR